MQSRQRPLGLTISYLKKKKRKWNQKKKVDLFGGYKERKGRPELWKAKSHSSEGMEKHRRCTSEEQTMGLQIQ
jgi:hypothetical protein